MHLPDRLRHFFGDLSGRAGRRRHRHPRIGEDAWQDFRHGGDARVILEPLAAACGEQFELAGVDVRFVGEKIIRDEIDVSGDKFGAGRLLVFRPTDRITLTATRPSRIAVIGGATLDGPRHVWWNFVSSRKERIEQAKNEWKEGRFQGVPGDEIEFIPLPENRPYTAGG